MIHLTYLKVDRFKQLREVELRFPQRCCALVEGLNEAGKSTLFEALFFALYGKGLAVRGRGRGEISSLIAHGESRATVHLGIRVNSTELMIQRRISRTRPSEAEVDILDHNEPNGKRSVRGVTDVNNEVLALLSGLDGDALLSSCFVQQKKLGQLEELDRARRQNILLKLLNMDRVTRLKDSFRWTAENARELETARKRYRIALTTTRMFLLRAELEFLERRLTLTGIHAAFEEIDKQTEAAWSAKLKADEYEAEAERLKARIAQVEALDRVIQLLDQSIKARAARAAREGDLERASLRLDEINRLECETLPQLEGNLSTLRLLEESVAHIAELEAEASQIEAKVKRLNEAIEMEAKLADPERELAALVSEKAQAETRQNRARELYEIARKAEDLGEEIETMERQRTQAEERKQRLEAAISRAAELNSRKADINQLQQKLGQAKKDSAEAKSSVDAARRVEELRRADEREAATIREVGQRRERLDRLSEQTSELNGLDDSISRLESELANVQARLDEAKAEYLRVEQSEALLNWAAARRDHDARGQIDQRIALDQANAVRAREQAALAEQRMNRSWRIAAIGAGLTGLGIVGIIVAILKPMIVIVPSLLLTLIGVVAIIHGTRQRKRAWQEKTDGEKEAERLERAAQDEIIRREVLFGRKPLDLAGASARLTQLGVNEPESPEEAENHVNALANEYGATLTQKISTEKEEERSIREALLQESQRRDIERRSVERELELLGLLSVDAIEATLKAVDLEQEDAERRQREMQEEVVSLSILLPGQATLTSLVEEADKKEEIRRQIENELARAQAEARMEEEHVLTTIRNDGAQTLEDACALINEIGEKVSRNIGEKEALKERLEELKRNLPENFDSDLLHRRLDEATGELGRIINEITDRRARINALKEQLATILAEESLLNLEDARGEIVRLHSEKEKIVLEIRDLWGKNQTLLSDWNLPADTSQAHESLAVAREEMISQIARVNEHIQMRDELQQQSERIIEEIEYLSGTIEEFRQLLLAAAQEARFHSYLSAVEIDQINEMHFIDCARDERSHINLGEIKKNREKAIEDKAAEASKAVNAESAVRQWEQQIRLSLIQIGIGHIEQVDPKVILSHVPDFMDVKSSERLYYQAQVDEHNTDLVVLRREIEEIENDLRISRTEVDLDVSNRELETLERRAAICQRAGPVLDRVRENILQSVLPGTLTYMRVLLPLLTCGRYHDAELDDETYKIRVWDERAQEFIEKDIFSGATQDQFSLALRLAFALATLPEGLGAQPKFIFLDEPTAGFDKERREALIRLLTQGELREKFDQVFLVVPEGIFNTNPLPHHIRIVRGSVASENLFAQ